ncbi:EthD family reductase [Gorillibacterium sp. sgz5001074]|uniref:EthD family reductase n=1 Tax=Gorillibacterium sp. sgz5001074 TaxID=3446695 RepID=UPI003F67C0B5
MVVLSFAYPYGEVLDSEYYMTSHVPKVKAVLASFEGSRAVVRKDIAPDKGPYQLTISLYFRSAANMEQFLADPRIPELQQDIANFYSGAPHVLTEEQVEV